MKLPSRRLLLQTLATLLLCSVVLLYTPLYVFGYALFTCTCLLTVLMITNLRRLP